MNNLKKNTFDKFTKGVFEFFLIKSLLTLDTVGPLVSIGKKGVSELFLTMFFGRKFFAYFQ